MYGGYQGVDRAAGTSGLSAGVVKDEGQPECLLLQLPELELERPQPTKDTTFADRPSDVTFDQNLPSALCDAARRHAPSSRSLTLHSRFL